MAPMETLRSVGAHFSPSEESGFNLEKNANSGFCTSLGALGSRPARTVRKSAVGKAW
jgi:hypothetical protein